MKCAHRRKKKEALLELEDSLRHDLEEEGATELLLYRKDAAPPPPPVARRIVLHDPHFLNCAQNLPHVMINPVASLVLGHVAQGRVV